MRAAKAREEELGTALIPDFACAHMHGGTEDREEARKGISGRIGSHNWNWRRSNEAGSKQANSLVDKQRQRHARGDSGGATMRETVESRVRVRQGGQRDGRRTAQRQHKQCENSANVCAEDLLTDAVHRGVGRVRNVPWRVGILRKR